MSVAHAMQAYVEVLALMHEELIDEQLRLSVASGDAEAVIERTKVLLVTHYTAPTEVQYVRYRQCKTSIGQVVRQYIYVVELLSVINVAVRLDIEQYIRECQQAHTPFPLAS